MKKEHKTMLFTVVVALVIIAIINNVAPLEPLKKQLNGNSGWF
ncbi:hypothetical protein ACVV7M_002574 [Vibrio vulnificus]|jgi:hypothetical protein|nr:MULTISPECIES: hypothetical protein [Vibrio]KJR21420.1 membrane protein [Vibrio sp. S234-5]MCU8400098.1 hypothetical protein [Vibrio vulnificus]